jgi:cbb3-type cytochrome oxidase maturation protein
MIIIALLISVSLIIALGFLFFFLWALKSGHYDDTETPSIRMLFNSKSENPKQDQQSHEANDE